MTENYTVEVDLRDAIIHHSSRVLSMENDIFDGHEDPPHDL